MSNADWFRDAVFYEAPVKSFFDGNGDGTGDFVGMTQKLDYLRDLGVNCIWLLPMYVSPQQDDGYDISDFTTINPLYGTMDDMQRFIDEAHARGLRVIADLVLNHTSDQHEWFQHARADRNSPYRDYYVWGDDPGRYPDVRIIFVDTETSNWTYDPVAGQYFWHRFFSHQPDLNYDNPKVHEEMFEVVRYWMKLGLDGFRCDAVPYLYERDGTNGENLPETHAFLKKLRRMIDAEFPGKILLAEANMWPEDVIEYFGTEDDPEFHMNFHFPLMPRLYMAVRKHDKTPIIDIMARTPEVPDGCQWGTFLRNHDELTLEMVTLEDRHYMWNEYAPEIRMRSNLGIRRRLATLMDNDRRRIELMNALLLSMPGSPVLYYGDEIGMGDNIWLEDRNGVRTPMQWTSDRNAGFSTADPQRLVFPVIADPVYGYQAVNVEAQERSPQSLLNWVRGMLALRARHQAFGRGSLEFLPVAQKEVLAYARAHNGETVICLANLGDAAIAVDLDLCAHKGEAPIELTGGRAFPTVDDRPYRVTLPAYGFLWLAFGSAA